MAVKATGQVTISVAVDVSSVTRYYLLQASTLTPPANPTASPPGGSWSATEPTYAEGSTNSLYTCDETVFSDGTWTYSSVSLSSSYEAAKAAYNKAVAAANAAAATDQHFWYDTDGAHVSATGDKDTSGFHALWTATRLAFRNATTELMTVGADLIELGKNSTSAVIKFCGGKASIGYNEDPQVQGYFTGSLTPASGARPSLWPMVSVKDDVVTMRGSTIKVGALNSDRTDYDITSAPMANLASLISVTGWTWLVGPYGTDGEGVCYRKSAGVTVVRVLLGSDSNVSVASGGTTLGTLPVGYRPMYPVVAAATERSNALAQIEVYTDGTVQAWALGGTSIYLAGEVVY